MKVDLNYSRVDYTSPATIKKSGFEAFNKGLDKSDCPISRRTHANGVQHWLSGWNEASSASCKGVNCRAIDGRHHSAECLKERERAYSGI